MIEFAGLLISGVSLVKDLYAIHKDLNTWQERDLEVDRDWLSLALQKGVVSGSGSDYVWAASRRVPTLELRGTHQVVTAHNDEKKILYRIVYGSPNKRSILLRKVEVVE